MPDLPTITVTQAQADRLLGAFGTIADYRTWLKTALREEVISRELEVILADNRQRVEDKRAEAAQNLNL